MATDIQTPAFIPAPPPAVELTINAKPMADTLTEKKDNQGCTCGAGVVTPPLERKNTIGPFWDEDEFQPHHNRSLHRIPHMPPPRESPETAIVNSSNILLSKVGTYDGVAELPTPDRTSVYLTTFPFTEKDIKKWTWLISRGIEDTFFNAPANGDHDEIFPSTQGYNRSTYYEPITNHNDVACVYVSRALDLSVVPKDTKEKVRYMIVVQNRNRPEGSKLLIAESRKAAGIFCFHEALSGNSVVFVCAVVEQAKKFTKKKLVRVESLEEAAKLTEEEGFVGVIC